jgi:hypothetical protein
MRCFSLNRATRTIQVPLRMATQLPGMGTPLGVKARLALLQSAGLRDESAKGACLWIDRLPGPLLARALTASTAGYRHVSATDRIKVYVRARGGGRALKDEALWTFDGAGRCCETRGDRRFQFGERSQHTVPHCCPTPSHHRSGFSARRGACEDGSTPRHNGGGCSSCSRGVKKHQSCAWEAPWIDDTGDLPRDSLTALLPPSLLPRRCYTVFH